MRKYFDVVFYTNSLPVVGAYVYVYHADGTLAVLFSDNGVTPTTNPLKTDSTGFYEFYCVSDTYKLIYVQNGKTLRTLTDVQIYDESGDGPEPIPPEEFGQLMLVWFQSIPTALPAGSGIFWNNGGTLALS